MLTSRPNTTSPEFISGKIFDLDIKLSVDETNKNFTVEWTNINITLNRLELRVSWVNTTIDAILSRQFNYSNSGVMWYNVTTSTTNVSITYKACVFGISVDDGDEYLIGCEYLDYRKEWDIFGEEALFVSFLFIAIMVFIGATLSAELALILSAVGVIAFFFLGFLKIGTIGIIAILICIVILIMRSRRG